MPGVKCFAQGVSAMGKAVYLRNTVLPMVLQLKHHGQNCMGWGWVGGGGGGNNKEREALTNIQATCKDPDPYLQVVFSKILI